MIREDAKLLALRLMLVPPFGFVAAEGGLADSDDGTLVVSSCHVMPLFFSSPDAGLRPSTMLLLYCWSA